MRCSSHIFLLFSFLFSSLGLTAQGIEWDHTEGDSGGQFFVGGKFGVYDSNYCIVGKTKPPVGNQYDGLIYNVTVKKDTSFTNWKKQIGGSSEDELSSIVKTHDQGWLFLGSTESSGTPGYHGKSDVWVVKTDSLGNLDWQRTYGGSEDDWGSKVLKDTSGGYFIAGISGSSDGDLDSNLGRHDLWTFKIDSAGNILWERNYGGTEDDGLQYSFQGGAIMTSDQELVIAGFTRSDDHDVSSNHGMTDYWLLKLDSKGSILWERTYGRAENDHASDLVETDDGGFVVTGYTDDFSQQGDVGFSNKGWDYWTIKVDSNGVLEWERALGGSNTDEARSIDRTTDGGFLLTGSTNSPDIPTDPCPQSPHDTKATILTIKLTSDGDTVEWSRCSGGSSDDYGVYNKQLPNGDILIGGTVYSDDYDVSEHYDFGDAWLVRLDTALPITTSSEDWNIGSKRSALEIYPNPVREKLTVEFGNNKTRTTHYRIYDKMGRKIREGRSSGQKFRIDLSGRSSGIYLVKVRRGSRVRTEKVVKE